MRTCLMILLMLLPTMLVAQTPTLAKEEIKSILVEAVAPVPEPETKLEFDVKQIEKLQAELADTKLKLEAALKEKNVPVPEPVKAPPLPVHMISIIEQPVRVGPIARLLSYPLDTGGYRAYSARVAYSKRDTRPMYIFVR